MKLSLFDTHSDTALELYTHGEHLDQNQAFHISLEKARSYERYAQYYAIWSNRRKTDEECWQIFLDASDYFRAEVARLSERVALVTNGRELETAISAGKRAAILAVEDARLTAGRIQRLDEMYARGVRYLTLVWGGDSCVGGAFRTQNGLTEYGKELVCRCFELGIIPDVSHASEQLADDVTAIAYEYQKPFIASHSNAFSQYDHPRNLRDRHFKAIKELGGIVGVSLCPSHLTDTSLRSATAEDVFAHVEYYLSMGGENILGFGADWDGTDLPEGFSTVGDLALVAEVMAKHNYTDEIIDKIFWKNFYDFSLKNL